jgi:hypothetical protein
MSSKDLKHDDADYPSILWKPKINDIVVCELEVGPLERGKAYRVLDNDVHITLAGLDSEYNHIRFRPATSAEAALFVKNERFKNTYLTQPAIHVVVVCDATFSREAVYVDGVKVVENTLLDGCKLAAICEGKVVKLSYRKIDLEMDNWPVTLVALDKLLQEQQQAVAPEPTAGSQTLDLSELAFSVVHNYCNTVRADSNFAWSIFCNLSTMAQDAGAPRKEANERAADLMQTWFSVNVRMFDEFRKETGCHNAAKPEPAYREPTAEDLLNGPIEAEFSDHNVEPWSGSGSRLITILDKGNDYRFVEQRPTSTAQFFGWRYCRIAVSKS